MVFPFAIITFLSKHKHTIFFPDRNETKALKAATKENKKTSRFAF